MRILAISNYFPPYFRGGYELSASIICQSLVQSGHTVDVITTQDAPAADDRSAGFEVHRILQDKYSLARLGELPSRFHGWAAVNAEFRNGPINRRIVERFLSGRSYDLAILFNLARVGTSLAYALASNSIPALWSFGDYWPIDRQRVGTTGKLARLNRFLWSRSAAKAELAVPITFATFNSEHLRTSFQEAGIAPAESWVVHRSCPMQDNLIPYSFADRQHTFIVTSQVEHHKGIHIVLQAAKHVHDMMPHLAWTVDIYGTGNDDYRSALEEYIRSAAIQDRIRFHGRKPHAEVLNAVKASIALIHPAIWHEPFGRVAIEAMACNTPLISADTGAIFEITDRSSSLIYRKDDASELAIHMRTVLEDESVGRRLAEAGLAIHQKRFTPEVESAKLEGVLKLIAQSRAT